MNKKINELLTEAAETLEESPSEILDGYLLQLTDIVMEEYGFEVEDALSIVLDTATAMQEAGLLPKLPMDESLTEDVENWVLKAKEAHFAVQVLKTAAEV